MKKFLVILFLSAYGLGQTVMAGRGLSSGFSSMGQVQQQGGFIPALPLIWVDNNEALDGINCGGQCSGAGYVAPSYELALPNTWVSGPPAGCTFNTPYWTGTPSAATAGAALQLAITDIEACRAQHGTAIILDIPPLSAGYSTTSGITVDSTATSMPAQFNIIRSTQDATLAAMPEPVCAGGIQDNVAAATAPGLINADCTGAHLAYQLGMTVTTISPGAFTLANGTATNTSNYNYVQYMPQITCTAHGCLPLALCNVSPNADTPCTSTTVSASFWAFYDLAIGPCPASSGCAGANNDNFIVTAGSGAKPTDLSQFNKHINFRRLWLRGDWTDLSNGENSIAAAFVMRAVDRWSIVGSQVSQVLRPGGEGHVISIQGRTGKIVNNWLEGQSSGMFAGGESQTPSIAGYIANTDMEIGENRETFPYSWLGSMCSGTPTNGGNACGNIPDANYYWGGAGGNYVNTPDCTSGPSEAGVTCVDVSSDGLTVTAHGGSWTSASGRWFHDSGSVWGVGHQKVHINNDANKCGDGTQGCTTAAMGAGTCSAWPASTGCPTSLTLQSPVVGAPLTNVPFTGVMNSIVRKNCHEMKEGARVVYYGNICENTDNSGGQQGINFSNAIRSISGNPTGRNYYADMHDVTVQGSIFRNSCNGFTNAGGRSAGSGNGSGVSWSQRLMSFTDILGYNITGQNPGCSTTDFGARISSASQIWTVTITENGAGTLATATATCSVSGGDCPSGPPSIGYEAFNILAGEPVYISGCTGVTAFNMPAPQTTGAGVGPLATAGSARWEDVGQTLGTYPYPTLTVTYPWVATANAVDSTGSCQLSNQQGEPSGITYNHLTLITDSAAPAGAGPSPANGGPYIRNHAFVNSIFLGGGWINNSVNTPKEGTKTEVFNYDATSMSAFKLVWPGRSSSLYTEYGNNSAFPDPSGCTGAGCTNPTPNMYFPATSCGVGFTYSCSGNMPLVRPDYHDFALSSGSTYHNAGSDGTDIGARLSLIDALMTTNKYTCGSSCGSPGPFAH